MTNSVNNAIIYLKEGYIMPNNDLFSDIPALGDEQGLENLLNQQTLASMGVQPAQDPEPAQEPAPAQAQPTYTNEQIQQIIARNQQLEAQTNQPAQRPAYQPAAQQQQQVAQGYNAQQIEIINKLLASGMTIGQINAEINKRRAANASNSAVMQRVQALEQHIQQQQYEAAASAFEQKMLAFGDKFGLSEDELVLFGETALTKGIDVTKADLETAFRAVYPDQYALRMQRITNNSTAPIYGGVSVSEAPRAQASKIEDAYVDSFLRGAMPNQYNMFNKK